MRAIGSDLHSRRLAVSFELLLGRPLLPGRDTECSNFTQLLFNAPFALVSHGAEQDPIFDYGNAQALALFELTLSQLCELPSRLSAVVGLQRARERMMRGVREQGFAENYDGDRVSSSGRRFRIVGATIWNITDELGLHCGQAAAFSRWEFE